MEVFCNQLSQSRVSPQGPTLELHPKVPPQSPTLTVQKVKFFTMDFFSKCKQIRQKVRIWSHLPKNKQTTLSFVQCPGPTHGPTLGFQSRILPQFPPQSLTPRTNLMYHSRIPPKIPTLGSYPRVLDSESHPWVLVPLSSIFSDFTATESKSQIQ